VWFWPSFFSLGLWAWATSRINLGMSKLV
jgi:hypothetical protein